MHRKSPRDHGSATHHRDDAASLRLRSTAGRACKRDLAWDIAAERWLALDSPPVVRRVSSPVSHSSEEGKYFTEAVSFACLPRTHLSGRDIRRLPSVEPCFS